MQHLVLPGRHSELLPLLVAEILLLLQLSHSRSIAPLTRHERRVGSRRGHQLLALGILVLLQILQLLLVLQVLPVLKSLQLLLVLLLVLLVLQRDQLLLARVLLLLLLLPSRELMVLQIQLLLLLLQHDVLLLELEILLLLLQLVHWRRTVTEKRSACCSYRGDIRASWPSSGCRCISCACRGGEDDTNCCDDDRTE